MEDFIFNPKSKDKSPQAESSTEDESIFYDENLKEVDETNSSVCAKAVITGSRTKYYLKQERRYGYLYNPKGMYSEIAKKRDSAGQSQWKFRHVNQKVFNMYIKFLETKNEAWLHNAERELV